MVGGDVAFVQEKMIVDPSFAARSFEGYLSFHLSLLPVMMRRRKRRRSGGLLWGATSPALTKRGKHDKEY